MTHRDPDNEYLVRWMRRGRSRPYEVAVLLILVVLVVSAGVHRKLGHATAPPPVESGWPQR